MPKVYPRTISGGEFGRLYNRWIIVCWFWGLPGAGAKNVKSRIQIGFWGRKPLFQSKIRSLNWATRKALNRSWECPSGLRAATQPVGHLPRKRGRKASSYSSRQTACAEAHIIQVGSERRRFKAEVKKHPIELINHFPKPGIHQSGTRLPALEDYAAGRRGASGCVTRKHDLPRRRSGRWRRAGDGSGNWVSWCSSARSLTWSWANGAC